VTDLGLVLILVYCINYRTCFLFFENVSFHDLLLQLEWLVTINSGYD